MSLPEPAATVSRFVVRMVVASAELTGVATVSMLSVAHSLLQLVKCNLACDVGDWKKAVIRERVAKSKEAEARVKIAVAEANKILAEADATRMDAETRRLKATAAWAKKAKRKR